MKLSDIFGKKKPVTATRNEFKEWLLDSEKNAWAAAYINPDSSINWPKVANDRQYSPYMIFAYDNLRFAKLIVEEYASFLGVITKDNSDDAALLDILNHLPEGMSIRRVWGRKGANKWCVRYNHGTEYYGDNLLATLVKIIAHQPAVKKRYEAKKGITGAGQLAADAEPTKDLQTELNEAAKAE